MKLHISAKDIELTPDIEDEIDKKLVRKVNKFLSHFDDDAVNMELVLGKGDSFGFRVRCELNMPGENIHAEESHKELFYAITALASELQRRLRKKKEKSID